MRLFVAAEIGGELAVRAVELIRELKPRVDEIAPDARVTWLTVEQLHVTIRFIGEVNDERAAATVDAMQPAIGVAPFDLTLGGTGVFPERGRPRVVWAGIERGSAELMAIERDVSARLARLGIKPEDKPYSPHLTLGRVREARGLRSARLLDGFERRRLGTVHVDAVTLFQSRPGTGGSQYTPLTRCGLVSP